MIKMKTFRDVLQTSNFFFLHNEFPLNRLKLEDENIDVRLSYSVFFIDETQTYEGP